jgi:uncharacterized membrane protein affecting hemolysin expression
LNKIIVIVVLAIISAILFGYVMYDSGFDRGSSSSQMSDNEKYCLIEYAMTCEQKRDEEVAMKTYP